MGGEKRESGTGVKSENKIRDILVVEDEDVSRKMIGTLLEKQGYQVMLAENGRDALAKITPDYRPELCLVDLNMPIMSGFEFLEMLRAKKRLYDVPVIVMTAQRDKHSILEAAAYGIDGYIAKPVEVKVLEAKIAQLGDPGMQARKLQRVTHLLQKHIQKLVYIQRQLDARREANEKMLRTEMERLQKKLMQVRAENSDGSSQGLDDTRKKLMRKREEIETKLKELHAEYQSKRKEIVRMRQDLKADLQELESTIKLLLQSAQSE